MGRRTSASGPRFVQYFGPLLRALERLNGSASPAEAREAIVEMEGVPESVQEEALASGQSRFDNQVAWARFYLVRAGLLDASSKRGVWALTEPGRKALGMNQAQALALFRQVHKDFVADSDPKADKSEAIEEDATPEEAESRAASDYRTELLEKLREMPPAAFERFCQRLLYEAGFSEVSVTGRSGDGGIDGHGILAVNSLVSFKVLFQCKRYSGGVSPGQVRDFRGAMMGRADKGIILTTGHFTSDARKEAVRDGATPIELVDAKKLIDMLESLEFALKPRRTYEVDHTIPRSFEG